MKWRSRISGECEWYLGSLAKTWDGQGGFASWDPAVGLCHPEASLLSCGDCGWQILVSELVSSQRRPENLLRRSLLHLLASIMHAQSLNILLKAASWKEMDGQS